MMPMFSFTPKCFETAEAWVSFLALKFFKVLLWLPNPMSLAYTHTLFMQENEVEHLAPPKSVNYN